MLLTLPITLPAAALAAFAVTRFHLDGDDLRKYDAESLPTFEPDADSPGNEAVKQYLRENFIAPAAVKASVHEKLMAKRKRFDEAGLARSYNCTFKAVEVQLGEQSVPGEWVTAANADPDRRLLYLHGGAGTVGSAISHRPITTNIAERTGCSVLAVDYRLMPENTRIAANEDSRIAYRWMLEHGPNGAAPAQKVAIAGDSAGGNLTLSLVNWLKEMSVRLPDAVVAISPATDGTLSSPSIKTNFETDLMLKPLAGPLLKLPRRLLLWVFWARYKIAPSSPVVSPIFADLSGLPPTLIHVSASEMLYDDARRYAAKAVEAGSPVMVQSWAHMAHVWHIFDNILPEARDAHDEIAKFLREQGFAA